ncbi:paralemmin-3 isoform X1 [Arapaima gigas]
MQSFIPTVLGVVQVQVEKDLKTGATIIKSVAPLAPGTADCSGEVLFDDGSKSVRAAGGADPSPEELGQVLSAVAGVGTLVEAQVMVNGRKAETEEAHVAPVGENGFGEEEEEDKVKCNASSPPQPEEISCENNPPGDTELGMNDGAVEGTTDGAVEGTITMTFLGFATAEPGQGLNGEDVGEIIRAERVIITDDGEDHPVMNEVPASEGKEEPSEPSEPPSAEKPHLDVRKENVEAEACSNGQINTDTEAEPRGAEADTEGEAEAKLDAGEGEKADEGDVPEATSTGDTIEAPQVTVDSRPAPDTVGAAAGDEEEKPVAAVVLTEQFQDVPLDSEPKHGTSATEPELQPLVGTAEANNVTAEQEPLVSASQAPPDTKGAAPSRADGGTAPKQKSCQCCSVMSQVHLVLAVEHDRRLAILLLLCLLRLDLNCSSGLRNSLLRSVIPVGVAAAGDFPKVIVAVGQDAVQWTAGGLPLRCLELGAGTIVNDDLPVVIAAPRFVALHS